MAAGKPNPNAAPEQVPLVAEPILLDPQEVLRSRGLLDPTMSVVEPASAALSALATNHTAEAANKNTLGTNRPSLILPAVDPTKTYLYLIPVAPGTPGAVKVKYDHGRAKFNLYEVFAKLDRLVPSGIREEYDVYPTPGAVTAGGVKGWGLYTILSEVSTKSITTLSEEEKAKRLAKLRATLAKKKAAKDGAAGSQGEEQP